MLHVLPGSILRFGEFELDCGRFQLRRNGQPLRIERKPMELLILLASSDGQVVTRVEIAERLWSSEVFVDTEHGINTAIRKLRYLLRDNADTPQFIQTVSGMGYRFIAVVSTIDLSPTPEPALQPALVASEPSRRRTRTWFAAVVACVVLALAGILAYRMRHRPLRLQYTQLTDFTDSAVAPALSSDGTMLAFIRGGGTFLTSDQIYVKMLPNGEARQVTDDNRPKYALAFSPDGSEIAYTVMDPPSFSTYEVPVLGGEPHLMLTNAAGLVWLNPQQVLFSEVHFPGIHLGVVTSTLARQGLREIYFPAHERGMAHYSFPSPDRRWALVVEMDGNGDWTTCKLVALAGQITPRAVGPLGACTSAGWAPDGRWMYFTAWVEGTSHIWRQRFPDGDPEQITFGPADEEGLAIEPRGAALITSVGVRETAIWIHDDKGERSLSSEGGVAADLSPPVFSQDAKFIYYLLRRGEDSGAELWRSALESEKSEAVLPGVFMTAFDLSSDGGEVVYTTADSNGSTQLWLAPVNRSSPAVRVEVSGAHYPHFGPHGQILFQRVEGNANYLELISPDGTNLSKVLTSPIVDFQGVSPGRRWATVIVPATAKANYAAVEAIPLDGGAACRICVGYCVPRWSTDADFMFVTVNDSSRTSPGRSLAIPIGPNESFPDLPVDGIDPLAGANAIRGARMVERADLIPGKDPEHYAWVNTTVHRNLYRISFH